MYALLPAQLLSCPILCDPMDCVVHQAHLSMGFPNGVGSISPSREIFLTQGLNLSLLQLLCSCVGSSFFVSEPSGKPNSMYRTHDK